MAPPMRRPLQNRDLERKPRIAKGLPEERRAKDSGAVQAEISLWGLREVFAPNQDGKFHVEPRLHSNA